MDIKTGNQKGQALILIALGIFGLVAMTALAIDGGNVFSERRRAQNAADTSALAGALEKINDTAIDGTYVGDHHGNNNGVDWYAAVENLINENMQGLTGITYTYTIPTINSNGLTLPYPGPDCKGNATPFNHDPNYIQVLIHIHVDTYLARVVGINQLDSCVDSIARAKPPYVSSIMVGNAIVALAPHECQAVMYQGTADTVLVNGGIFVNSDNQAGCTNGAFFSKSGSGELTAPFLNTVGWNEIGNAANLNITSVTQYQTQLAQAYPPDFMLPDPTVDCGPRGTNSLVVHGNRIGPAPGEFAGNWEGAFPPAGVTYLDQGLYCIYGDPQGFVLRKQDSLFGNNVTLAVMTGKVDWTGSSPTDAVQDAVALYAPQAPSDCATNPRPPCYYAYNGLLIYLPMSNPSSVTINGNSHWYLEGTILAPASLVTISGTEDGFSLSSQIIAYQVKLTGGASVNLTYNASDNWTTQYAGKVELSK